MTRRSRMARRLPGHPASEEQRPAKRRFPRPWLQGCVAGGVSLALVVVIVVVAPRHLLDWDTAGSAVPDRARAINDIRTTLLQGLAGLALLVGAFFTWRQLRVSHRTQITARFTAAVEHLGSTNADVRIGAIFALERVAVDSREDRGSVAEVLCSFVQRNAPAAPLAERPVPRDPAHRRELARTHGGENPLAVRAADVQAAMRVLGRRPPDPGRQALLLSRVDLRRGRLPYSDLADADLHYADLTGLVLVGADLRRADLTGTWLAGAALIEANLHQASLRTAVLWHSRLEEADFRATDLTGADLTGSVVDGARFDLADLRGAVLTDTNLSAASLSGAVADATTVWPSNFDAAAFGVLPADDAPALVPLTYFPQEPTT